MSSTTRPLPIEPLAAFVQLHLDELRQDAARHSRARSAGRPVATPSGARPSVAWALRRYAQRLTGLVPPRRQACPTC